VLTLGAEGALLTHQEGHERIHPPKVDIVSPRGAGDSFVAALTLQLTRGASLSEALRYGVAGAAAALLTPGTELLRREDTQRFYQKISH
jgi:6-phosphofructokinase 2